MAGFESIHQFYNYETDNYDLPTGLISRHEIEKRKAQHIEDSQVIRDRLDAEKAYDPYDHCGCNA